MEMLFKFLFLPVDFLLSLFGIFDDKRRQHYEFYYMLFLIIGFGIAMVYCGLTY